MKLALAKIYFPALGIPLNANLIFEYDELTDDIKELIQRGVLVEID